MVVTAVQNTRRKEPEYSAPAITNKAVEVDAPDVKGLVADLGKVTADVKRFIGLGSADGGESSKTRDGVRQRIGDGDTPRTTGVFANNETKQAGPTDGTKPADNAKPVDAPKDAKATTNTASKNPLDDVTITERKATFWSPTPWKSNEWMPGNWKAEPMGDELGAWRPLHKAAVALNVAEQAVPKAEKAATAAHAKLDDAKKKLDDATKVAADKKQIVTDKKAAYDGATTKEAKGAAKVELDKAKKASQAADKTLSGAKDAYTKADEAAKKADKNVETSKANLTKAQAGIETAGKDFKKFLLNHMSRIKAQDKEWNGANKELAKLKTELAAEKAKGPNAKLIAGKEAAIKAEEKKKKPDAAKIEKLKADIAAEKAVKPDQARIEQLEKDIEKTKTKRDDREKQIRADIDKYVPIEKVTKTYYSAKVDGVNVELQDTIDAYSSDIKDGLDGNADSGMHKDVNKAIDNSKLSDSNKKIMKAIASMEGGFSSVNTYDNGIITWGMHGWTTGDDGNGDLIPVMRRIEKMEPDAYKQHFTKYGIGTDKNGLTYTQPDGKVLHGAKANDAIRTNPKLNAVLAAAGADPKLQEIQIQMAKEQKIDGERAKSVTVKGDTYKYSDLITSEYGMGLMASAAAHAGGGAVAGRMAAGLKEYLDAHPDAKKSNFDTWKYEAEKVIWKHLEADDQNRATYFKGGAGMSQAANSYKP